MSQRRGRTGLPGLPIRTRWAGLLLGQGLRNDWSHDPTDRTRRHDMGQLAHLARQILSPQPKPVFTKFTVCNLTMVKDVQLFRGSQSPHGQ